jgi:hypothetical protein
MWDINFIYELAWFNDEIILANRAAGFLSLELDDSNTLSICDTLWDSYEENAVCIISDYLWLQRDGILQSLPLFQPVEFIELKLTIFGNDVVLNWEQNSAAVFTVYRCPEADFQQDVIKLGTTEQLSWVDADALISETCFYRVRMGQP